jgi:hypothetical protein
MIKVRAFGITTASPGSITGMVDEMWNVRYVYLGPEQPPGGHTETFGVLVKNVDYSQQPVQIVAFVAAAIRANALAAHGLTIAANDVIIPDITKA